MTARRIWLCADDYGMAPGVNVAILDLIVRGRLNATSVMVGAPSFDRESAEALAALNAREPRAAIGLHFTLTAPFAPLSSGFRPLHAGAFLPLGRTLMHAMLRRFDVKALAAEADAQFAAFAQAFGRPPDFVDGHQHVQVFPQVRDVVLAAMKRHAPSAWVRQSGRAAGRASRIGDPKALLLDRLSRIFRRRASASGIVTNPAFAGTYVFDAKADFPALFPRFLEGLPDDGLIMCHPGFVDADLKRLDPVTDLRAREYTYFASEAFVRHLAQANVMLAQASSQMPHADHHLSAIRRA